MAVHRLPSLDLATILVGQAAFDKKRASSFQLSQDGERPSIRNVSPPKVIRTHRPRIADDFFKLESVRFGRARIDMSGSILAGGHNLKPQWNSASSSR
jgi:hypothetical protein